MTEIIIVGSEKNLNEVRAERARLFLEMPPYCENEHETSIIDLLTDMRHFAHQNHIDFESAFMMSNGHFEEEITVDENVT